MDRYEIKLGKETSILGPIHKDGDIVSLKDILPLNNPETLITDAAVEAYLGEKAEDCFVIASRITGCTSSSIPTEDTVKIAVQLMHLPNKVASKIRKKINGSI